jgi:hypothetical protein
LFILLIYEDCFMATTNSAQEPAAHSPVVTPAADVVATKKPAPVKKTVVAKAPAAPAAKPAVAKKAAVAAKPVAAKPAEAKKPVAVKNAAAPKAVAAKKAEVKKPEVKAAKPAKVKAAAPAAEKQATPAKEKVKKTKLVRDSFSMPEGEYAVLGAVKKACLKAGIDVKKSELLRIGVALIQKMDVSALKGVLATLQPLKAGRPKQEK